MNTRNKHEVNWEYIVNIVDHIQTFIIRYIPILFAVCTILLLSCMVAISMGLRSIRNHLRQIAGGIDYVGHRTEDVGNRLKEINEILRCSVCYELEKMTREHQELRDQLKERVAMHEANSAPTVEVLIDIVNELIAVNKSLTCIGAKINVAKNEDSESRAS